MAEDNTQPEKKADEGLPAGMRPVEKKPVDTAPRTVLEEVPEGAAPGGGVEIPTENGATGTYTDENDLIQMFSTLVMPATEQVEEWKQKHGGVILVRYPYGMLFIHRILTRAEYRELIYTPFELFEDREDEIVRRTLLWPAIEVPQAFKGRFQGLPSTLSEYILDRSGFMNALEVGNA